VNTIRYKKLQNTVGLHTDSKTLDSQSVRLPRPSHY